MEGTYFLDSSGKITQDIKNVLAVGRHIGLGREVSAALQRILNDLRCKPNSIGTLVRRLPNLQLDVRLVYANPLYVEFGVNEVKRIVYIRKVELPSS